MKTANFTTSTKEQQLELLAPLTELAFNMFQAGTLKKNIIKHFANKGLSFEASENITEIGLVKFERFSHYTAR